MAWKWPEGDSKMMSAPDSSALVLFGTCLEPSQVEHFQKTAKEFLPLVQLPERLRLADQPVDEQLPGGCHPLGIGPGCRLRVVFNVVEEMAKFDGRGRGILVQLDGLLQSLLGFIQAVLRILLELHQTRPKDVQVRISGPVFEQGLNFG